MTGKLRLTKERVVVVVTVFKNKVTKCQTVLQIHKAFL